MFYPIGLLVGSLSGANLTDRLSRLADLLLAMNCSAMAVCYAVMHLFMENNLYFVLWYKAQITRSLVLIKGFAQKGHTIEWLHLMHFWCHTWYKHALLDNVTTLLLVYISKRILILAIVGELQARNFVTFKSLALINQWHPLLCILTVAVLHDSLECLSTLNSYMCQHWQWKRSYNHGNRESWWHIKDI